MFVYSGRPLSPITERGRREFFDDAPVLAVGLLAPLHAWIKGGGAERERERKRKGGKDGEGRGRITNIARAQLRPSRAARSPHPSPPPVVAFDVVPATIRLGSVSGPNRSSAPPISVVAALLRKVAHAPWPTANICRGESDPHPRLRTPPPKHWQPPLRGRRVEG